jgi:3',5'-cyclic-AMP phosphodiesterase
MWARGWGREEAALTFIQITDPHLLPGGRSLYGTSPRDRLADAVDLVNTRFANAELVLVTGDLANRGEAGSYDTLREVLAPLETPAHLMLGNHDDRALFRAAFPNTPVIEGGYVQFVLDVEGARVLCVDSLSDIPDDHGGQLCATRLSWLQDQISATPTDRALIVACHHPPFDLGMPYLDASRLSDAEGFFEVLAPRKPDMMLFGHVHRPISGAWRGIPFHIQRAVNHQVGLQFEKTEHVLFTDEPGDIGIIRVTQDGVQVFTHAGHARFGEFGAPND